MREDPGTSSLSRKHQSLMTVSKLTLDRSHALRCEVAGEVLRCFGRLRLKVTGWSMLPAIWPGDVLELERAKHSELSQGQIILFSRDRRLFVHRIWKAVGSTIVTRGDAIPHLDPVVTDQELLGRVAYIERHGKSIQPSTRLSFWQKVVAGLVRSSDFAARVIVGIYSLPESKASS
jgi:signal peptidase I